MNHLDAVKIRSIDLINYYCPHYSFKWTNGKRIAGYCDYSLKTIGISKQIARLNTIEEVLLTVIHEISHALTFGNGHNMVWKQMCKQLGGDGERCFSINKKSIPPPTWRLYNGDKPHTIRRYRRFKVGYPWRWVKEV